MVIIFSQRVLLISSSSATSVVDFHDPVGPVTKISPCFAVRNFATA